MEDQENTQFHPLSQRWMHLVCEYLDTKTGKQTLDCIPEPELHTFFMMLKSYADLVPEADEDAKEHFSGKRTEVFTVAMEKFQAQEQSELGKKQARRRCANLLMLASRTAQRVRATAEEDCKSPETIRAPNEQMLALAAHDPCSGPRPTVRVICDEDFLQRVESGVLALPPHEEGREFPEEVHTSIHPCVPPPLRAAEREPISSTPPSSNG